MSCSAPAAAASSSRRPRLAVRSDRRCDSPRQNVSAANVTRRGWHTPGRDKAASQRINEVLAGDARQIVRLGSARRAGGGRGKQRLAVRLPDEPEDDVPARVEIVSDEEQLAEAGMAEVVGQQVGIAPAEIARIRRAQGGSALENAPERRGCRANRCPRVDGSADERPQRRRGGRSADALPLSVHQDSDARASSTPIAASARTTRGIHVGSAPGPKAGPTNCSRPWLEIGAARRVPPCPGPERRGRRAATAIRARRGIASTASSAITSAGEPPERPAPAIQTLRRRAAATRRPAPTVARRHRWRSSTAPSAPTPRPPTTSILIPVS